MRSMQDQVQNPLRLVLRQSRGTFAAVALFSAVVNILGLTGSFYMLQVYDRVLASRSVETLIAISALALGLFILQGLLDVLRARVMNRLGARVERALLKPVHDLILGLPMFGRSAQEVTQPLRDMEAMRLFAGGPAPLALMDLPWTPLYLLLIWMLHPWLGGLTLAGMAILSLLTVLTEISLRESSRQATIAHAHRQGIAETSRRHVEVIRAMGFASQAARRFFSASADLFAANERMADVSGTLATISKTFRTAFQSAVLGLGAYLVIRGQVSGGAIIAASILSGRALQPVEMVIAHWKQFVVARQARNRLAEAMRIFGRTDKRFDLPLAKNVVEVENIAVSAPGSTIPIIARIAFKLKAGDGLAILGPSGAGKSTLARALVGAWAPLTGEVRLDGAPLHQWPEASLGRLIGYLPQEIDLFDGTVAENISRLDPEADEDAIFAAAQAAQVHDLILRLPQGYATHLGENGYNLSAGQRQRIGLARALYRDPFLVVLDEPNAHLDIDGEQALARALCKVRERGGIVAVVSHRREILAAVNLLAVVADRQVQAFGERDAVLQQIAVHTRPGIRPDAVRPPAAPAGTSPHFLRMSATMVAGQPAVWSEGANGEAGRSEEAKGPGGRRSDA